MVYSISQGQVHKYLYEIFLSFRFKCYTVRYFLNRLNKKQSYLPVKANIIYIKELAEKGDEFF